MVCFNDISIKTCCDIVWLENVEKGHNITILREYKTEGV